MRTRPMVLTFGVLTGLISAGYGVMFTVLDDFRDDYGVSKSALGVVVGMGFFASFLAQVFVAPFADRGHARKLVAIGMVCSIAGMVAMAFAESVGPMMVARFVMGVGAGMASPAVRRIVILSDPEHLGHNIGRLLAAEVAGFAIGPAISAVLVGPFGIAAPFLVVAVATAACLPIVFRVHVQESETAPSTRLAFDLLRIRPYVGALVMGTGLYMMIGTFDALWVQVLDDLGTSDAVANLGVTIFALPFFFLGSIGGRMAQRVGPFRLGTVGLLWGACFMFAYGQLTNGVVMTVFAFFHSLGDGITFSSTGVAVGLTAPAQRQAAAQGLVGGMQTLTGGFTAIAAGAIYDQFGRTQVFTTAAIGMVVAAGTAALLAGRQRMRRPDPMQTHQVVVPAS